MSYTLSRAYVVGLLTGSGLGMLVGWVLNSAYWFNGSTSGTPIVGGITAVLCGAGVALYSFGHRAGRSTGGDSTADPAQGA